MTDDNWTGSWCPQCGPDVKVDEDGCCIHCGCDCTGDGAELALNYEKLVGELRIWAAKRGKDLCPGSHADTFGEGVNWTKDRLQHLLRKVGTPRRPA